VAQYWTGWVVSEAKAAGGISQMAGRRQMAGGVSCGRSLAGPWLRRSERSGGDVPHWADPLGLPRRRYYVHTGGQQRMPTSEIIVRIDLVILSDAHRDPM
jgi:hypothetical protein